MHAGTAYSHAKKTAIIRKDHHMSDPADRRRTPRGVHEEAIVIKVISSSDDEILPGRTFLAKTADISLQGLRIRLNHEPAVGCTLEMWVVSHRHEGTLVLNGTVRWARPSKQDGFTVQSGIELSEDPGSDFLRWRQIVADLLPQAGRPATQ